MTKPTSVGPNRTGIAVSPMQSKEAIESAREGVPSPSFDTSAHHATAVAIAKSVEPLGTMPPPASVKGVAKTAMQAIQGHHPNVFLDLMGERLAFERTGVRLYEALLVRYDAADVHAGSPARADLERIRDEELAHFHLLVNAMQKMGADPTAVTPSADVAAVTSLGLVKILTDPRATLTQGLQAILIAELADNDAWAVLSRMAEQIGQDALAADFQKALQEEEEHLRLVRTWVANQLQGQLGVEQQGASAATPDQPQPGA